MSEAAEAVRVLVESFIVIKEIRLSAKSGLLNDAGPLFKDQFEDQYEEENIELSRPVEYTERPMCLPK